MVIGLSIYIYPGCFPIERHEYLFFVEVLFRWCRVRSILILEYRIRGERSAASEVKVLGEPKESVV